MNFLNSLCQNALFVNFGQANVNVKHIYALAAAAGALVCCICVRLADIGLGYIVGFAVVFVLRLCAAHFRWDLPKARNVEEETK